MTQVDGFNDKVQFIWSIADILRGDVRQHEYGQFILPFVVLRRLDCVLEPTKQQVIDKAASLEGKVSNVGPILERAAKAPFYNVSPLTFTSLVNDDKNIRANLLSYIAGFSPGAAEVLEKYRFAERVNTLDKAGLLYQVVARFADVDLHPDAVPNHAMGYIFEELLRRFSEMQNETAGEHFTPREVIELMVNLLLCEDADALSGTAPVRTMYDPACGTGGMLATAQTHLRAMNPEAQLQVFGQELNPETWAVCRSDMLIKSVNADDDDPFASGSNPENIAFGNSLTADGHEGRRFDYMLANPPFGVDWKKYAEPLVAEAESDGWDGRFGAGLPRTSDGSFLFLQHMISKMKPVNPDGTGGTRLGIVFSGSPLFSGGAGSGESNIRKWIIENDWLEAVVGLPDQLFYNTGINTYFWILTNRKTPDRKGKVLLLDARGDATKMRKSLGNKRYFLDGSTVAELTRLYMDAPLLEHREDARVKVLSNEAFGFQRITVEQPLRRRWALTAEALVAVSESRVWGKWAGSSPDGPVALDALTALGSANYATEKDFQRAVVAAAPQLPPAVVKEVLKQAATPDPDAPIITDRRGTVLPDPDLRGYENVALHEAVTDYMEREVHPFVPEAWADESKTRIGYEIPFTREFYTYVPSRPVAELDAEILERESRIRTLLEGLA